LDVAAARQCSATHRAVGLNHIGGALIGHPVTGFGNVATPGDRLATDRATRQQLVIRAICGDARTSLGQVTQAHRGTAYGSRCHDHIGWAICRAAVAHFFDITGAADWAAHRTGRLGHTGVAHQILTAAAIRAHGVPQLDVIERRDRPTAAWGLLGLEPQVVGAGPTIADVQRVLLKRREAATHGGERQRPEDLSADVTVDLDVNLAARVRGTQPQSDFVDVIQIDRIDADAIARGVEATDVSTVTR
jgi:hypothetical protein